MTGWKFLSMIIFTILNTLDGPEDKENKSEKLSIKTWDLNVDRYTFLIEKATPKKSATGKQPQKIRNIIILKSGAT